MVTPSPAAGSPIAVCVLPEPPPNGPRTVSYPGYVHEILAHAGVCYAPVAADDLPTLLPDLRVLVTVGGGALPDDVIARLHDWVRAGGGWLSIGGVCGAPDLFGVEPEGASFVGWGGGAGILGEGYLYLRRPAHAILSHLRIPLHYFNGLAVRATGGDVLASALDAHGRPTSRATVVEASVGDGRCLLIAPDLTGAVVRIQQGVAITRDGVPAADGTGSVCDGVLKSDDGCVLDWLLDRQPVPGAAGLSGFLQPVADQWREVLLRALFYLAREGGAPLPLLWLYPRDLPALGHLSHDSDGNQPAAARRLLAVLDQAGVNSTWCLLAPGYPADVTAELRRAGHELAMHYDAISEGMAWSEDAFDQQWRRLTDAFGGEPPRTNKNHYLRWQGDTEFFEWLARRGIGLDESKGATKTGGAGFGFGTCHPYFPVDPAGRPIDVLELPTPTQDLMVFAPEALGGALLAAVAAHHGVLHLLFHPAHIETPGVADALLRAVRNGAERGLEWWTARRIGDWERARRSLRWLDCRERADGLSVQIEAGQPLPEASLLFPAAGDVTIRVDGEPRQSRTVERWGFRFGSVVMDIEPGRDYRLEVQR
jgi:peptidoglycan/xylan/chitin deacetylase (PgdA/CDA1 family)